MRKWISLVLAVLVLGPLAGCSPEGPDELASASRIDAASVLLDPIATNMSCGGGAWAAVFQVDLEDARELVPPGYDLLVGKSWADGVTDVARMAVTAIACETFTWSGTNYPTRMLMVTLDLAGPPTGEADPTMGYGYVVLEQVTSPAFHARVAGYGERAELVKAIEFGGPTSDGREGWLEEANGAGLRWTELQVMVLENPVLFPMNGQQYSRVGTGAASATMAGDTQCLEYLDGVGGIANMHPFVLEADARSSLAKLGLGTYFAGLAVDAGLVTCTGHIYRMAKSK